MPIRLRDTWNPRPSPNYIPVLSPTQLDVIEELSTFHCTESEIAHAIGISHACFTKIKIRNEEVLRRVTIGQSKGKTALRSVQFKVALQGNVNMLMYLGRVILNQCPEAQININTADPTQALSDLSQEAKQHLQELAQAITQTALGLPAPTPQSIDIPVEARIVPETEETQQTQQTQSEKRVSAPHIYADAPTDLGYLPKDPVKHFNPPPEPEPPKPKPPPEPEPPFDSELFDQLLEDAKHRSQNGNPSNIDFGGAPTDPNLYESENGNLV